MISAHWDFDIAPSDDLPEPGVAIEIEELNESTAVSFGNPAFIQNLRRVIARDYALHLHRGLVIKLDGKAITGWQIELRSGGGFSPMRMSYDETLEGGQVKVEILAGMAAPPPDSADPDAAGDGDLRSGWYVVCNGRIVLAADKSQMSGWGTESWPKWHPQYAGFIGFVLFASESAALLPLTTTKRNVDAASAVFRRALPRMREVSRQWIGYTIDASKRSKKRESTRRWQSRCLCIVYGIAKRQSFRHWT